MTTARFHHIERTSPKGGPFLGTCVLCGKTGLRLSAANEPCDNVRRVSAEDAIVEMIDPKATQHDSI